MPILVRELVVFIEAIRFYTRIPVTDRIPHSPETLSASARYFPAVGILVGLISALTFVIADWLLPFTVAVLIAMLCSIYLTGAFHEDGLADMIDGLGGGWDKIRILEIMKDSRIGSYGAVAIVMSLLGKFVLLSAIDPTWVPLLLICGHSFSRYCCVLIMANMVYVREDKHSKSKLLATQISRNSLLVASFFGLTPLLVLPTPTAISGALSGILITVWLGKKLQKWLGGYTGDCLGATQMLSELAFYLGALAVLVPR